MVLTDAFRRHPERFVHGSPEPPSMPEAVWINPPAEKTTRQDALGAITSTPDDLQHPPLAQQLRAFRRSRRPRRLRGSTLNANANCLKVVDTFRAANLARYGL